MIVWPTWLWIGTPFKLTLWLANRLATWTGLAYVWRRFRTQRHRWIWLTIINTVSLAALAAVFFWLHIRSRH